MDLRDALSQIAEIRQQVARTETFRGYKALPVAFSGLLAIVAAVVQSAALPAPAQALERYLALWLGAALVSIVVTGVAVALHCWRSPSPLTRQTAMLAIGQFVPSLAAGGLIVLALWHHAPESLWLLPGLWSILFGLGIFASWRLLPRATFWVGVHYLVAGTFCLAWAQGEHAFSPWAMGVPFGVGQLLAAGILYWTLERRHEQEA